MAEILDERPDGLPMEDRHVAAEEAADNLGGRIRNCLRSAYRHLRLSWTLHPLDSEMSLFRAITAEEEAATALILALKQKRYEGAEKLAPRNHVHKAAVSPFLDAVNNMLSDSGIPAPRLFLRSGNQPRIDIEIDIAALTGQPAPRFGLVDEPFNYLLRAGESPKAYMFEGELAELARERGAGSIGDLVAKEANLRNRLLYASDHGVPQVEFQDAAILRRRDRVHRLALLTVGIMQTNQRQLFAAQCLRAYCAVLGHIVTDPFDHVGLEQAEGFSMSLVQHGNGGFTDTLAYRKSGALDIGWSYPEPYRFKWPEG